MIVLPRRLVALFTASLLILSSGMMEARPDRTFTLTRADSKEISNFIRLLEEAHYNREQVDASSYPSIVNSFMEDWDAQHLFFLKSDADSFNTQFGEQLYWNVRSLGTLDPAFEIFQRYEQRVESRAAWVFQRLEGEFDTQTNQSFKVDRSEVEWLADEADADAVWEKRLLFEIEQELLNDRDIDEAKDRVRKRYERRLKYLADIETHEITELFLANIAQLYDPHSTYFSAETYEDFSIQMRLQLVGIGALLGMEEDECVIKAIIPGGPADLDQRLKPNDKIIAVSQDGSDSIDLIGMKLRKIVDKIRGERGTPVHLTIQPAEAVDASERTEIVLVRDVVNLDSARARGAVFEAPDTKGQNKSIGVITLPTFYGPDPSDSEAAQNSATGDIAELISQMQESGIDGLVLDLRDNGGGLLSEAIDLTGLFIEQGPVVQVRSYYGDIKVDEDEDSSVRYAGPLAVLVSKFSASASEIVAGALQNYGRAVVLGDSSTHGKGTVQTVYEMRNLDRRMLMAGEKSGAAKFTIQKFYLPSGSSTQRNGVVPDIVLPSLEDVMESGERFLPQALVWDEIPTTEFDGAPLDRHILTLLRDASLARRESLEEFQYLQANIDWFTARQEEEFISLNLDQRIERRDADKTFRDQMQEQRKRLREDNFAYTEFLLTPPEDESADAVEGADETSAVTTELATSETDTVVADAETANESSEVDSEVTSTDEEPEPEGYARLDVHLREAVRVIVDAVEIGNNPVYADHAPLTARPSSGG